jgi:hypothetical protein
VRGIPAAAREAASREKQRIYALREQQIAAKAAQPTWSWWRCEPDEPPAKFYERAHERAAVLAQVRPAYLSELERVS